MRIRWTKPAVDDLTRICNYLVEHESPTLARTVAQTVYSSVPSLAPMPRKGRNGREPGTRELIITRYPYIVVLRIACRSDCYSPSAAHFAAMA